MRKRRRSRLGSSDVEHNTRARKAAREAIALTRTVVENAGHGHCTRAFDALNAAQLHLGEYKAETHGGSARAQMTADAYTALTEARQTFFRRCVVPQR